MTTTQNDPTPGSPTISDLCNMIETCWEERDDDARFVAELVLRGDLDRAAVWAQRYAMWCVRAEAVRAVRLVVAQEVVDVALAASAARRAAL